MKNFMKVLAGTILLVLVIGIHSVDATPRLRFTYNDVLFKTVEDGSPDDGDSDVGEVEFEEPIGIFDLKATTGLTKPSIGTASDPKMDLFSFVATGIGEGKLEIAFSENYFAVPAEITNFYSLFGGTLNDVDINFSFYADTNNVLFGTEELLFDSTVSGGLLAFSDMNLTSLPMSTEPFSLTIIAEITNGGGRGLASFDANIEIPEPATLILLGSGLIGAAVYSRRKKVS